MEEYKIFYWLSDHAWEYEEIFSCARNVDEARQKIKKYILEELIMNSREQLLQSIEKEPKKVYDLNDFTIIIEVSG